MDGQSNTFWWVGNSQSNTLNASFWRRKEQKNTVYIANKKWLNTYVLTSTPGDMVFSKALYALHNCLSRGNIKSVITFNKPLIINAQRPLHVLQNLILHTPSNQIQTQGLSQVPSSTSHLGLFLCFIFSRLLFFIWIDDQWPIIILVTELLLIYKGSWCEEFWTMC